MFERLSKLACMGLASGRAQRYRQKETFVYKGPKQYFAENFPRNRRVMRAHAPSPVHRRPKPALRNVFGLITLSIAVGLAACSPSTERPVEQLLRQGDVFLDPETLEPFTGLAFATFDGRSGGIAHRLSLNGGIYHGPFEAIFADRRLSSKEVYEDGVKHGPYEWYFENGQIFEEGTYVQGRLDGPYRAYWESGELYEEGTYRGGRFDGPRRWYLEGRLVELVTYSRGVIDGLYERYRPDGSLQLKGMLDDGLPCGMWIEDDRPIAYPDCGTRVTE
jgi:hypothetical protein